MGQKPRSRKEHKSLTVFVLLSLLGTKEIRIKKRPLRGRRLPSFLTFPIFKLLMKWLEKLGWVRNIYFDRIKPEGELLVEKIAAIFKRHVNGETLIVIPDSYSPRRKRSVGQLYRDALIAQGIPPNQIKILQNGSVETGGKAAAIAGYLKYVGNYCVKIKLPVSFYYKKRALGEMIDALSKNQIAYASIEVISIYPRKLSWGKLRKLILSEYSYNVVTEPFKLILYSMLKMLPLQTKKKFRERAIRKERTSREK